MEHTQHSYKKWLIVVVIAAILLFLPNIAFAKDYSIVKVKLSGVGSTSVSFVVDGNYVLNESQDIQITRQSYKVKLENNILVLYDAQNKKVAQGTKLTFKETQASAGKLNLIKVKGNQYLGSIVFSLSPKKTDIYCVNHVFMEDYVAGVIPYEIGNSSNIEALKAQAIIARTYVARYLSATSTYDLGDTSSDQVYNGYNVSHARSRQAIKETENQMLLCDGELAKTYYSASNGGFMDHMPHVWSSSTPLEPYTYLRKDPYDLRHPNSLKETLRINKDGSSLHKNVEKYFKDLAIQIFAGKTYKDKGYDVRLYSDLKISSVLSITPTGRRTGGSVGKTNENHDLQPKNRCPNHSSSAFKEPADCYDECPNYTIYSVKLEVLAKKNYVDDQDLPKTDFFKETIELSINALNFEPSATYSVFSRSNLRLINLEEKDAYFEFQRMRFGHGIGLSQRGSQQQANEGRKVEDIVYFYYPNTQITKMPLTRPSLDPSEEIPVVKPPVVATGIAVSAVNLRNGPSQSYTKIGELTANEKVEITVINYANGWHQLWWNDSLAYVSGEYVKIDDSTLPDVISLGIATGEANIRTGPSTSSSSLGKLKVGQVLYVTKLDCGDDGEWIQCLMNGVLVYIHNDYVSIEGSPLVGLSLSPELKIQEGQTSKLIPTLNPTNAACSLKWSTSDPLVLTVDNSGNITALSSGVAIITVTDNVSKLSATCTVTVEKTPEDPGETPEAPDDSDDPWPDWPDDEPDEIQSITLDKNNLKLSTGQIERIDATVTSTEGGLFTINWQSSNPAVAEVDELGLVTANASGKTTITASVGNVTATCEVEVTPAITKVYFENQFPVFKVGDTSQLAPQILPAGAPNKSIIKADTSNSSVVSVTNDGIITAHAEGQALVRVMMEDGGKVAQCYITVLKGDVKVKAQKVVLDKKTLTLSLSGKSGSIKASVLPKNATNQGVYYLSRNTKIATVDQNGVIKPVGVGTALVGAVCVENGTTAACYVTVSKDKTIVSVKGYTVTPSTVKIYKGKTKQLSIKFSPTKVSNPKMRYKSAKPNIVSVSDTGLIKGLAKGASWVYMQSLDSAEIKRVAVYVS